MEAKLCCRKVSQGEYGNAQKNRDRTQTVKNVNIK